MRLSIVVTNLISIAASASASASVCLIFLPLIDSSLPSLMPFAHIELYAAYSPREGLVRKIGGVSPYLLSVPFLS